MGYLLELKHFLELYDRGGWLTASGLDAEYYTIMVGNAQFALYTSAYNMGLRDFDVDKAYQAMKKIVTVPGRRHECSGLVGIPDLEAYRKYGYVPYGTDAPKAHVSNTLNYAFDEYVFAQLAKQLGREDDYNRYIRNAFHYKNIFHPEYKYMWLRKADGSWIEDFSPLKRGGFVEGNASHYTYMVPHDPVGLIELVGRERFIERLDNDLQIASQTGFNSFHDRMWEIPVHHGNEINVNPVYMFNYAGVPWKTQYWVREVMDKYYGSTPYHGWLGDEDEGKGAAWYVISAMGLFQMNGGTSARPFYEIGSPLFDTTIIHLDTSYYEGSRFTIIANNNSDENRYIDKARLNGNPLNRPWFYASELTGGGELWLQMSPTPDREWGRDHPPPSLSGEVKDPLGEGSRRH